MQSSKKRCEGCNTTKPKTEFVSRFGFKSPRGQLCHACWAAKQKYEAVALMDGRESCLYCGVVIPMVRDYDKQGKVTKTYLHMDHMDPVSRGGYDPFTYDLELGGFTEDTSRNCVYCCSNCNLQKSDMLYVEWLEVIPVENRQLALQIYIERNGASPEEFVPQDNELSVEIDIRFGE